MKELCFNLLLFSSRFISIFTIQENYFVCRNCNVFENVCSHEYLWVLRDIFGCISYITCLHTFSLSPKNYRSNSMSIWYFHIQNIVHYSTFAVAPLKICKQNKSKHKKKKLDSKISNRVSNLSWGFHYIPSKFKLRKSNSKKKNEKEKEKNKPTSPHNSSTYTWFLKWTMFI